MATIAQSRILSTPAVYVTGVLIKIVPNTCSYHLGNGSNPRAVSSGGGVVDIVNGIDASKLLAMVKFEMASTAENVALARSWINNANLALSETVRLVELADQYAFDQMYLANDVEAHFKSDGNLSIEWKGRYVP